MYIQTFLSSDLYGPTGKILDLMVLSIWCLDSLYLMPREYKIFRREIDKPYMWNYCAKVSFLERPMRSN